MGYLLSRKIESTEIVPGIVLHMDPDVLAAEGAVHTCSEVRRVRDRHFFVCVEVIGEQGRWVPLYSRGGLCRVELPRRGRSGHPKWIASECYYHAEQVWDAPHKAVVAAALAGNDLSEPKCRNRIAIDLLPRLHDSAA